MESWEVPGLVMVHWWAEPGSVMGGCRLWFHDLVLACWWMGLAPDTAVCRDLGIPKLMSAHWWVGLQSLTEGPWTITWPFSKSLLKK